MTLLDRQGRDVAPPPASGRRLDLRVPLFATAAFLGAGLVFLIQPMVVRLVLPSLGGSPAVWTTASVFFQAVLLAGYGYAHLSTRALGLRRQPVVHLAVLAVPLVVLPLALPSGWRPPTSGSPVLWLVATLAVSVGLPYFAISSASPLLQRWFSATDHPRAADPYFLYAAGNAGSMVGLLAYPVLVEPTLSLRQQAWLWSGLYAVFLVLAVLAVVVVRRSGPPLVAAAAAPARPEAAPSWVQRGRWVFLAAVPASLLLGVTTSLTTDVASVPFLWVLPLAVYLATFVIAFGRRRLPLALPSTLVPVAVALVAATQLLGGSRLAGAVVLLHLTTLFLVGLLCHGRLAADRPDPSRLTGYFFLISLGGVVGGAFNALVAPLVFDGVHELPLALGLALLARPVAVSAGRRSLLWGLVGLAGVPAAYVAVDELRHDTSSPWLVALACVVVAVLYLRTRVTGALALAGLLVMAATPPVGTVLSERTFFGVLRVQQAGGFTTLRHGTTVHGRQPLDPIDRANPSSYYHPSGPIGQLFSSYALDPRLARIAVVGLGTGTFTAYARPNREVTFYEIDPAVVDIASNPRWFTYLSGAQGPVDIVLGDARLSLQREPAASYGMLVLDAFTSDAVPSHLLTTEAIRLYFDKLEAHGLVVLNISNRYLDLTPVLAGAVEDLGLSGVVLADAELTRPQIEQGKTASTWVVLARDAADLVPLEHSGVEPIPLARRDGIDAWTDDHSNLLEILDLRWW